MTTTQKWTPERVEALVNIVGPSGSEVSREEVAQAAAELGVSERSITSKLAKIEGSTYTVEKTAAAPKAFSDADTAALSTFLNLNPHAYTYATLATAFENGKYSAKALQGKVLALKLTDLVNKAEKTVAVKTYTDAEEATLVSLASGSLEAAAAAVNRTVQSVRGKYLSLLKEGKVTAIPKQENHAEAKADVFDGLDITKLTVDGIVEALAAKGVEKTARGIKTTLTKRKLQALDYPAKAKTPAAA